jgi:electron-transferring-flavoprotein dehydrogenase
MLAAETAIDAVGPGATAWTPGTLAAYDDAVASSFIRKDLWRERNLRPAFQHGFVAGSVIAGLATTTLGRVPRGDLPIHPDAASPVTMPPRTQRAAQPDGVLAFDKLSSVYLSGNRTRDDAPDHIRIARQVPREVAQTWVNMCPAHVYEIAEGASGQTGTVTVEVTASNCIQCGAITAKGGRLTPPEGGDGPEYTLM